MTNTKEQWEEEFTGVLSCAETRCDGSECVVENVKAFIRKAIQQARVEELKGVLANYEVQPHPDFLVGLKARLKALTVELEKKLAPNQ